MLVRGKRKKGTSSMTKVHRIAGLKISRVQPAVKAADDFVPGREVLPDLEPPETRLRSRRAEIFSRDALSVVPEGIVSEATHPSEEMPEQDFAGRMTVYVMNATVMVFALPVGLALLLLNILGGENLRTTAHVMALTGVFMALGANGDAMSALPFL